MTTLSIWVRLSKNQVYEYNVILDAHYTRERERGPYIQIYLSFI